MEFITLPLQAKDIGGQHFGRLTAIGPVRKDRYMNVLWLCQCTCGNQKVIVGRQLWGGKVKSCGCLQRELSAQRATRHGLSNTRAYSVWGGIKERCMNPNNDDYALYGGRGIRVHSEWINDFKAFYEHVAFLPHFDEKNFSLDRIDNERGYEPGNVRWATSRQQGRNTRVNVRYEYSGENLTMSEWSEKTGIAFETLRWRICRRGWPIGRALTEKPQRSRW